jgi:hypothetical protein
VDDPIGSEPTRHHHGVRGRHSRAGLLCAGAHAGRTAAEGGLPRDYHRHGVPRRVARRGGDAHLQADRGCCGRCGGAASNQLRVAVQPVAGDAGVQHRHGHLAGVYRCAGEAEHNSEPVARRRGATDRRQARHAVAADDVYLADGQPPRLRAARLGREMSSKTASPACLVWRALRLAAARSAKSKCWSTNSA